MINNPNKTILFICLLIFVANADKLCGVGQYGSYEIVDNTLKLICNPCNVSCYDCSGPGPSKCISCKTGFFLESNTC